MKFFIISAALLHITFAGHVEVKMPFLNSAGVTYVQGHEQQYLSSPYVQGHEQQYLPSSYSFEASHYQPQQVAYESHNIGYQQQAYRGPAAVGVAHVPVKTAVAVPTVHHVPAVADVPVTKYEAQPAVLQKLVDVAKPAIKTRKFEVRRPAIQKQFYDIEERTIVRPVGSALVELAEPLSKSQKGPALVSTLEDQHQHAAYAAHQEYAVQSAPSYAVHAPPAYAVHAPPAVAVHAPLKTVAITPAPHGHVVSTIAPVHSYQHAPVQHLEQQYIQQEYLAQADHHYVAPAPVHVTPAPIHITAPHALVSSTPAPHYDSVVVEAVARNAAAKYQAYEKANLHNAQYGVESFSNGAPQEHLVVKDFHQPELRTSVDHLSHEEAQDNQQKLIKLLTARGGVAEVGFEQHGHLEPVGDAGISRARVLSATPSPYHEPVEEKLKTRRIVVSRPVQTVQEIDVVEPATKIEQVAVQQPAYIKTAKLGYERIQTSVPVYGKALAPAIAHAQVPVEYYHH